MGKINWFPGHMKKTQREIKENLKLVDAVIEIRDARIARSSANPDIDKLCEGKPRIILLNKSDKSKLLSCFNKRGGTMSDDEMKRFALYSEMIHDICDDDEWNFGYRRRFLLDKLIWNLLQEYGLEEDIPVG